MADGSQIIALIVDSNDELKVVLQEIARPHRNQTIEDVQKFIDEYDTGEAESLEFYHKEHVMNTLKKMKGYEEKYRVYIREKRLEKLI